MSAQEGMVRVTDPVERIAHWILAVSCLFCVLTGLGLMFHSWSVIPELLGGYYATKWMHIFSGVIFTFSLVYGYFMWKKDCEFEEDDLGWILQGGGYLWQTTKLPPVYKYNAGQKAFFWFLVVFGAILVISGLIMWNPLIFPVMVARFAYMLHAMSVVVLASFIVVHIYLGTIGNPGTVSAMITGLVSKAWCETHCPRWYAERNKKPESV
ncbi:MAG: formate dehydrogenase subunit gamma [Syntrophaceae bacterium]